MKNLYSYEDNTNIANSIQVSDIRVDNIYNNYYYSNTNYSGFILLDINKMIATNSILNISTSPITTLEADKCTIEVQNNLAFKNLIANQCSIKGDFVGTAVDYEAQDLFLKILRLRDHPNEYVSVSVDGGESAGGTVDTDMPEITDTSLRDVYLNVNDALSLSITATSKTKPSALSYQWYKDGVKIDNAKGQKRAYFITKVKAEQAGVYYCEVTDNNNGKVAKSKEVYVSANAPIDSKAPVIMGQSSSMELVAGSSVKLSVSARPSDNRSGLLFQWYKGTTVLDGKTSRTLDLTKVKASDAGSYHCMITDDLVGTTIESSVTVISVK